MNLCNGKQNEHEVTYHVRYSLNLSSTHLFSDSREYNNKRDEECEEEDVECDGRHISSDRSPIAVTVECGSAISAECIEPPSHFWSEDHKPSRATGTNGEKEIEQWRRQDSGGSELGSVSTASVLSLSGSKNKKDS